MHNQIKSIGILILVILVNFSGKCQNNSSDSKQLEDEIIKLDKSGWEAWKNNDATWFKLNTTENFVSLSADGISNKSQVIKATANDCNVISYALSEIKFIYINENSVLLTYIATQDGKCGNVKLSPKLRVAANYIKQNKKWLEAFYMETKID
jgi:hypothetical protein